MQTPGECFRSLQYRGRADEASRRQGGAALIVCLLMMVAVLMLGTSGAQIAIQEQKASHNERDSLVAQQAAEAALKDAELDIENSVRAERFLQEKSNSVAGTCEEGLNNPLLGLCHPAPQDLYPVWQKIDLQQQESVASVPFGYFTRRNFTWSASAHAPRYIIEVLANPNKTADGAATAGNRVFRITAIGYGKKEGVQVVLQAYYRKSAPNVESSRSRRLAWREILNWEELRDVRDQE